MSVSYQYVFENGFFQISEGTSCLFTTLIWQVIERVHVVCSSWFSWRYGSLLRFGIGGPRLFPKVAATMISKRFCEIAYKSVLLNVMENRSKIWQIWRLAILWKGLEEQEGEIKNSWEIVFWWHDFFDFTWLYMITFHLFSALCQRRYSCWNIGSEVS